MTTGNIDKRLNEWLVNTHALEEQAEKMLMAQAERIQSYPELSARIAQHLEETRSQRNRLEGCMARRGISESIVKDLGAKFMASMQGLGGSMMDDEVVKGGAASYAFEHFEEAHYMALVAAAQEAGDAETARVCEEIRREEEAMGDWLKAKLPHVVRTFLQRDQAELAEAKR